MLLEATASQPKGYKVILTHSLTQAFVHQIVQNTVIRLQALESIYLRLHPSPTPSSVVQVFSAPPSSLAKWEYQYSMYPKIVVMVKRDKICKIPRTQSKCSIWVGYICVIYVLILYT